jgi:hypothetical protein
MLKPLGNFIKTKDFPKREPDQKFLQAMQLVQLFNSWGHIVGPMFGKHTVPSGLYKGKLFVISSHPAYAQEMRNFESQIVKKVNQSGLLQGQQVKQITTRYHYASFVDSKKEFQKINDKKSLKADLKSFSPEEVALEQSLFPDIDDPEVRDLLVSLSLQQKNRAE